MDMDPSSSEGTPATPATAVDAPTAAAHLVPSDGSAVIALPPGEPVMMGRSPTCGIVVQDQRVSRHHATFSYGSGRWWVEPGENVTNPLLVNGTQVDDRRELLSGDFVNLGRHVSFVFRLDESEERIEARRGSDVPVDADALPTPATPVSDPPPEPAHPSSGRPPRLVVLDTCQALVEAVPAGWHSTVQKWVISACDVDEVRPGDVYQLWEARNTAAHATPGHVEHTRIVEAAAIAHRIADHLAGRGIHLRVYATDLRPPNESPSGSGSAG